VRADVHVGPDGRPKGSGIVAFESPDDVINAIQQFNGYDWQGRPLEVDSLAQPDLVVAVDLAVVEGLAVALERVEVALVLAEGLAVDLGVVVAATVVVALEAGPLVALTEELVLLLQHQIHLLTSLLLAQKEARPSMSAM